MSGADPHSITVSYGPGGYEVSDSAGVVLSDPEHSTCVATGATTARCADRPPDSEFVPDEPAAYIEASAGDDTVDLVSIAPAAHSVVHAFAGNDRVIGSPNHDLVYGYAGDDTLIGNGGNDSLFGGPGGKDTGADTFDGGPGGDFTNGESSEGGYSVDTVTYAGGPGPVSVTPGFGDGDDGQDRRTRCWPATVPATSASIAVRAPAGRSAPPGTGSIRSRSAAEAYHSGGGTGGRIQQRGDRGLERAAVRPLRPVSRPRDRGAWRPRRGGDGGAPPTARRPGPRPWLWLR